MVDVISMEGSRLPLLAKRIQNDIDLREQSRGDWVTATLDLSLALAEARDCFPSDKLFGQWLDGSGIDIGKNERVAYIAFGRESERARGILEQTKSNSIRLIYKKEFCIPSVGKVAKGNPHHNTTPKLQKALDAYDALVAAGITPTQRQVEANAGVSTTISQKAFERRKTEETIARQDVDLSNFSSSARDKVEAAVRRIQKRLELDYDRRLQEGIQKHISEFVLPMYAEKLELADRIMATNRKPFTIEEYRRLLAALHPDGSSVERRQEMFILVKEREALLRPPEKDRPLSGDLPRTLEELLARKKKK